MIKYMSLVMFRKVRKPKHLLTVQTRTRHLSVVFQDVAGDYRSAVRTREGDGGYHI